MDETDLRPGMSTPEAGTSTPEATLDSDAQASAGPSSDNGRSAGDARPAGTGVGDVAATEPPVPPVTPHAGVRYAVLRLATFAAVGGTLYIVGLRNWALLFLAVLLSGIVSFFVFMRQRNAAAANLEHTVHDWSERRHPSLPPE